ncbi:MAG: hypothetical protein DIU71_17020 [Proteobacteria bacterium]|nr:MAG: hypothetical protein DIU71_17020 [Pseudomonadota bacterium]
MIKTATFTALHVTIAFTVVYAMTGDFLVGGAVALIEPLCNSVGYFLHERVWDWLRHRRTRLSRTRKLHTAEPHAI